MELTYFRVKSRANYFHLVTDTRARCELNTNYRQEVALNLNKKPEF